ncbi:hypothetical protein CgunFtcFv8_013587 [Champsocephalus gunnari]|uniref:Uncharacterized protein n=1 Tax=Champsocephalus gunnari TaxID=52237 RepID=A0AAN8DXL7_CHAGU|nr:hypothetical protein CgunFtcFv8_013587 [Champsocephalus gunnari]
MKTKQASTPCLQSLEVPPHSCHTQHTQLGGTTPCGWSGLWRGSEPAVGPETRTSSSTLPARLSMSRGGGDEVGGGSSETAQQTEDKTPEGKLLDELSTTTSSPGWTKGQLSLL